MVRACTICGDPQHDEIDRRIIRGDSIAGVSRDFAVSEDALGRHVKANHHIRDVTAIPTSAELATSEDIYKEIEKWHAEAKDLQNMAKSNGDIKTALFGLEKALKCLELLAKIHGQIREQNVNVNLTQVNIYNSPEWQAVGSLLARILAPYPELRAEVARELLALQEAQRP
ncbi:MAG: hypothetical protein A4E48_02359 [Methanosaeta sp. PtaU1.Bin060]|jgi:hypothetical protein|nr:MAG: hypothetical protein A4E44_02181 [Methanosaeta sp. PtaB.Bin018]OPY49226.1 MAG: hypothetical protein A4E48_02359 [Methanosaeta sp. PtaU1.Bin060]